ncbi:MAG: LptF/LptG family permease [Bacteroidales bacterium]|nr:LptF/LptG family permease [Bacteroidales bacterium]
MKKLDKLIVKSFVGPLLLTFVIAVFVLLMQFIWKYVDDIAGKGLSVGVILELLLDASATFVPMAMPIAVLFASIMTMGNLGERYELVAIKSGGIPLWRAFVPMGIIVLLLTGVAYVFADYVMPSAVLKYRTTLYDITRKKPALNIRPGEYYSDIDDFVIRVDEKDKDGKTLHGITIYDKRNNAGQPDVVVARNGMMQTTPDERYLIFTLYDGCSYSESSNKENAKSNPFTRIKFSKNVMSFDMSQFAFDKSEDRTLKGGYQMMNIAQLDSNINNLEAKLAKDLHSHVLGIKVRKQLPDVGSGGGEKRAPIDLVNTLDKQHQFRAVSSAATKAERYLGIARMNTQTYISQNEYIRRHYIEWHRKFTLSVACIVLFLVGAPFGSVVRKGGLGLPLVASLLFFVLYYVVGMIAEKAVRESAIGTYGMWISTFVMLPIGIYLIYRAVRN